MASTDTAHRYDVTQPPTRTATHFHSTGAREWDTKTTLRDYGTRVVVTVDLIPGLTNWSTPPTATIRKWVDELLAENTDRPRKRDGQRYEFSRHPGWGYTYYTKAA